jgi:hypothetical protein
MGTEMAHELRLSDHVQSYIDSLDLESDFELGPEELADAKKTRRAAELIVADIIASRETLTDNKLAFIEKLVTSAPETIAYFLDDRLTRDVVLAVPGYVARILELSRLEGSRIPSKVTNGYLREAVRTYILGLPQSSVALCRAALEQAIKENLGYQGTRTFVEMNGLLDEAEGAGIIDGQIRRMARKIASEADDVLHEKPTDLTKASEVLLMLRGVFQHLYAE